MSDNKRNYGIDLLRVVSMMMVCILHVLNHGGVLEACVATGNTAKIAITSLFKAMAMCAVNCYAMISGYVGCESRHKLSNIIYLTLQVTFYSVIITGIFFVCNRGVGEISIGIVDLAKAFFPGIYGQYWYFSSYFVLFFFIPVLNVIAEKSEKSLLAKTLFAFVVVVSIFPTLFHADPAKAELGFSTIWLMVMYLFGAYLKKYNPLEKLGKWKCLLIYAGCVLVSWLAKFAIEGILLRVVGRKMGGEIFYEYISPTIVVCAIALVSVFANMNLSDIMIRFTKFFAPISFGVYLGHELKVMREAILVDKFCAYADMNIFLMVLAVLFTALAFWFVFSMVDKLRLILFDAIKIRKFCDTIGTKIENLTNRLLKIEQS